MTGTHMPVGQECGWPPESVTDDVCGYRINPPANQSGLAVDHRSRALDRVAGDVAVGVGVGVGVPVTVFTIGAGVSLIGAAGVLVSLF